MRWWGIFGFGVLVGAMPLMAWIILVRFVYEANPWWILHETLYVLDQRSQQVDDSVDS